MLEVEEDYLHQDQDEDAADEQQRSKGEMKRKGAKEQGRQDRRAEDLPAPLARLELLENREAHGSPSDEPAGRRADQAPSDRVKDRTGRNNHIHGCKVSRMASSGAARPVHISNDCAPCARSTAQPSAVRSPRERALRISGVPPVT